MIDLFLNYLSSIGLDIYKLFVLCFLVGLASFVDSIAGGGGLISLPAYLLVGVSPRIGAATNKMTASFGATVSFTKYVRYGYVNFKVALPCVIAGFMASGLAANLVSIIDENIFKFMLVVTLPIVLVFVLRKKTFDDKNAVKKIDQKTLIKCIIGSFAIGLYDGLYGPGTGTFLILLFTGLCKLKLSEANGIAKSINFATNISALLVHLTKGNVLVPLGILVGIFSMIGGFIGTAFFKNKGSKIVKPIMVLVLLIFIIKVVFEVVGKIS